MRQLNEIEMILYCIKKYPRLPKHYGEDGARKLYGQEACLMLGNDGFIYNVPEQLYRALTVQ